VRSNLGINGEGDYNPDTNRLTVFAGSVVSENISSSKRLRSKYVADRIVKEMVSFNSPSTAANFITGNSSNGLLVWKDKQGRSIKDCIKPVG
jgi:hypothetical protein